MNPREMMLEAVQHHQTPRVPYTLYFEGGTDLELDAYLGTPDWRERLKPYIVTVAPVHGSRFRATLNDDERNGSFLVAAQLQRHAEGGRVAVRRVVWCIVLRRRRNPVKICIFSRCS